MKQFERVVAAALAGVVVSGVTAQDAVQWRVEDGGNGHWYQAQSENIGWYSAKTSCEDQGGHLITVTNQAESDWILSILPSRPCSTSGGHWYIGAYQEPRDAEPAGFRWVTGETFDYTAWSPSSPSNSPDFCSDGEDAIGLFGPSGACELSGYEGMWNDLPVCDNDWGPGFIIEWSADCNGDGIVDYGQIQDGTFADANGNGVPDVCEAIYVPGDYPSIQEAIDAAPDGGIIRIGPGTFVENLVIDSHSVRLEGAGRDQTTIDGNATLPVIRVTNVESLHIADIRITNGRRTGDQIMGGGVSASGLESLSIEACLIDQNVSDYHGGGLCSLDVVMTTILRTDFIDNIAGPVGGCCGSSGGAASFRGQGGGVPCLGASSALLEDCRFIDNRAFVEGSDLGGGGALSFDTISDATLVIRSCHFEGNTAEAFGSCLRLSGPCDTSTGSVEIVSSIFLGAPDASEVIGGSDVGDMSIETSFICRDSGTPITIPYQDLGGNLITEECSDADCNQDGISDYLQIFDGTLADCDGNGVPDFCDLNATFAASEPRTPESVADFIEFDVSAMADAGDTVILDLSARGDLATSTEFMFVYLDDVNLGLAFATDGASCEPVSATFEIPAADWNLAGLDGTRLIRISGNAIEPDACENPFTAVDVTVPLVFEDCNENGLWDACEIADGTLIDTDADGISDDCDGCPSDANKTDPGICGCGIPESGDTDGDGILDCVDPCPDWPYDCSEDGRTLFVAVGQSIQSAIDVVPDGGVVEIAAGTFQPDASLDPDGRDFTLRGAVDAEGKPLAIIDGQNSMRIMHVHSGETAALVIENLIIRNGNSGGGAGDYGGGILIFNADASINNCVFEDNIGTNYGGALAIQNENAVSETTVTGCVFTSNAVIDDQIGTVGGRGGAIAIYLGNPAITECVFSENQAQDEGGAIHCNFASPSVNLCNFENNSAADDGGAVFLYLSVALITDCDFSENTARKGGAMYNRGGEPTLVGCNFISNSATLDIDAGGGGAMYNSEDSNPRLSRCHFESNTASYGGAIINSRGNPILDDCTFTANVADIDGGGMYSNAGSDPSIIDCTICGNIQPGTGQIAGGFTDLGGNCISEVCDSDDDGVLDCNDLCPGEDDLLDTDGDGIADCLDPCPNWPYDCSEDGQTIFVGVDQSISAAIAGAPAGGIVDIAAGTFTPGSSIDPGGKAVTIQGAVDEFGVLLTIIDAEASGSVLVFQSGEGPETTVRDIVLTGGASVYGGGIECSSASSPTILGCLIIGNTASEYGGGINCYLGCNPSIEGCTIRGNTATMAGGGVSVDASSPTILGCVIEGNTAPQGAGIYLYESDGAGLGDSTVCGNLADQVAGSYTDLEGNCIVDECGDDLDGNGIPDACDPDCDGDGIPDGLEVDCDGNGIADDCEIADGSADDCNGNGVPDACDIADGLEEDDNLNQIPDSCEVARGDLNLDGCIDSGDLGLLIALWGFTDPPIGDLNGDGIVAAADLGLLIGNWAPCP